MKALSIQQPWAWLITHGYKDIENRRWRYAPSYRGQLLIHAGKTFDEEGYWYVKYKFPEIELPGVDMYPADFKKIKSLYDTGGFVAQCRLNDVVYMDDSPWFTGPLGFKIRMPKPIEFIPFKGQLGLFDVPDSVIRKINVKEAV